jgi:hypothetical protein
MTHLLHRAFCPNPKEPHNKGQNTGTLLSTGRSWNRERSKGTWCCAPCQGGALVRPLCEAQRVTQWALSTSESDTYTPRGTEAIISFARMPDTYYIYRYQGSHCTASSSYRLTARRQGGALVRVLWEAQRVGNTMTISESHIYPRRGTGGNSLAGENVDYVYIYIEGRIARNFVLPTYAAALPPLGCLSFCPLCRNHGCTMIVNLLTDSLAPGTDHPLLTIIIALCTVLVGWRIWAFSIVPALRPDEPRLLPYWIPFLGKSGPSHAKWLLKHFFASLDMLLTTCLGGSRPYLGFRAEPGKAHQQWIVSGL